MIRRCKTLYCHEMRRNMKSLVIWTLCVGAICFGCLLLYASVEESIGDISDLFSDMGAMSAAFGMDKMSLATLTGYYATEIAMIHGLGGAMFAALLGSALLSKEEAGHTAEFLYALPIPRGEAVFGKYLALLSNLVLFETVCTVSYLFGFRIMGEETAVRELFLCAGAQLLMMTEIGSVCFLMSAFLRKIQIGAGLGIALVFFALDLMCRIIPAIENGKYLTPFYYSNAADIYTEGTIAAAPCAIGLAVTAVCAAGAWVKYTKKDLAS